MSLTRRAAGRAIACCPVIVFRVRWTPADRAESGYRYLPVEVPTGVDGLRIEIGYDRSAGVIDLGCIDAVGWCGWSGAARQRVQIGRDAATPGYLARGMPAGLWQVVLGLHRIPSAGLDCQVNVEFAAPSLAPDAPVPVPERPPRRDLPATDGLTWLAGDLHAHTVHSDGALGVDELAALAVRSGLDFLAVTDHNTVSHHRLLPEVGRRFGIALIPGQELTTAEGHANAFGDVGWIDFRRPALRWLADVDDRGGLLSINHPIGYDCAWRHPLPGPPPLAEVWHSSWLDRRDGGCLAWWRAHGLAPIPVGGSDWHRPGSGAVPGSPTTWIACADGDVLGGLAAGRTAISAGRDAPVLVRVGEEMVAVDSDGAQLVCPDGRRTPVRGDRASFSGHHGPHLVETDDRTVLSIAA
jgi:hypothetical protein